jgi:hypothetical protein
VGSDGIAGIDPAMVGPGDWVRAICRARHGKGPFTVCPGPPCLLRKRLPLAA